MVTPVIVNSAESRAGCNTEVCNPIITRPLLLLIKTNPRSAHVHTTKGNNERDTLTFTTGAGQGWGWGGGGRVRARAERVTSCLFHLRQQDASYERKFSFNFRPCSSTTTTRMKPHVRAQELCQTPSTGLRHPSSVGGRCQKAMLGVWSCVKVEVAVLGLPS